VHPRGVTYYFPTLELLTAANDSPLLVDIGNSLFNADLSDLPHDLAIHYLVGLQETQSALYMSREKSFRIAYFPEEIIDEIEEFVTYAPRLSKADAEKYVR
jgi:hypothetical protein